MPEPKYTPRRYNDKRTYPVSPLVPPGAPSHPLFTRSRAEDLYRERIRKAHARRMASPTSPSSPDFVVCPVCKEIECDCHESDIDDDDDSLPEASSSSSYDRQSALPPTLQRIATLYWNSSNSSVTLDIVMVNQRCYTALVDLVAELGEQLYGVPPSPSNYKTPFYK